MNRFSTLAILCLIIFVTTPALADMECSPEPGGDVLCRGFDGTFWRGEIDSHLNEVWRETKGNVITGRTNRFGDIDYQAQSGAHWKKSTNMDGQEEWNSNTGRRVVRTNPDAHTRVYTDRHGDTLTCTDDTFRDTFCRERGIGANFPLPQLIPLR